MRRLLVLALLTLAPAPAYAAPADPLVAAPAPREAGTVVGRGTPASCTSAAFRRAVARGGRISFDCGPRPVTIRTDRTAVVRNTSAKVVIDGGGRVTLDGRGEHRILYLNTCDPALGTTTSHCQDQATPELVLRGLTFAHGDATGQGEEGGGGGAVLVRGGRLSVRDSTFTANRCDRTGPDLGGAALRVLDQYRDGPVRVSGSRFVGNRCSNGAGLSSIGVSWVVSDSEFRGNRAVGVGANPARPGTPGGGSGGAMYFDGDDFTVMVRDTVVDRNRAREGGGAIFFVSNDRTGTLAVRDSQLSGNPSLGFETYPGIFYLGHGAPDFTGSVVE